MTLKEHKKAEQYRSSPDEAAQDEHGVEAEYKVCLGVSIFAREHAEHPFDRPARPHLELSPSLARRSELSPSLADGRLVT